jgi:hypothetical protein
MAVSLLLASRAAVPWHARLLRTDSTSLPSDKTLQERILLFGMEVCPTDHGW